MRITGIRLAADAVYLTGSLVLGDALGGVALDLGSGSTSVSGAGFSGSASGSLNGVVIDESGAHLAGGKIAFPDYTTTIFGGLKAKFTGLALSYDAASDTATIQGKIAIPSFVKGDAASKLYGSAFDYNLSLDFSGTNYIKITQGLVSARGEFNLNDYYINDTFTLKNFKINLAYNQALTGGDTLSVSAGANVGFTLAGKDIAIGATIGATVRNGNISLNTVGLSFAREIPIADTGLFFESIAGKVDNISADAVDDTKITLGPLVIAFGPQVPDAIVSRLQRFLPSLTGPIATGEVSLAASYSVSRTNGSPTISLDPSSGVFFLSKSVVNGTLSGSFNISTGAITATAAISLFEGTAGGSGTLTYTPGTGASFEGTAFGKLPDNVFTRWVGAAGLQGTIGVKAVYVAGADTHSDTLTLTEALGRKQVAITFYADGSLPTFNPNYLPPPVQTRDLVDGTTIAAVAADTVPNPVLASLSVGEHGRRRGPRAAHLPRRRGWPGDDLYAGTVRLHQRLYQHGPQRDQQRHGRG